jgi:uncharacterized membrane protein
MAGYKERVKSDLDRWIAGGLVAGDKRDAILATIPDARRLDAATTLAYVGAVLFGIAVIAFISANWDVMAKLARFVILLAAFLAIAGVGAWAVHRERPILSNIALLIAALVFAASIGLTGQIFDIAGNPKAASYGAGIAGFALALAGRSTGAAIVGLVFVALGDITGHEWFSGAHGDAPWMLAFAPLGAFLALRWGSAPLAHVSALAIIYCFGWFAARTQGDAAVFFFLSIGMGAMAAGARWLYGQDRQFAGVFYGWFAWGALVLFAMAGYLPLFGESGHNTAGMAHRLVWLAASGALTALGRYDRHALVTAVGVLSLIGAVSALLIDLGLDLLAAAGVFMLCAIAAMIAGFMLRRRPT